MGVWYSTMTYIKSFYQPVTKVELSETKIVVSANRLAHSIRLRSIKIQQETKKKELQLLKMIESPKKMRNAMGEQILMGEVVRNSEELEGFEEIIYCCETIKKEAKNLEKNSGDVSEKCKLAICTIIYAYNHFNLKQWINLSQLIPEPHPNIKKQAISQSLREYVEFQEPSLYAINTYALQLGARNNISLEKINEAGHNFVYSPSKVPQRESKSSHMFAIDLEQYQMGEQPYSHHDHMKNYALEQ